MHDILNELYLGNYRPFARSYAPDSPYLKQSVRVSELQDELARLMSAEQREKLLEYVRESSILLEMQGEEDFCEGFRLGVRLMLAALGPVSQ